MTVAGALMTVTSGAVPVELVRFAFPGKVALTEYGPPAGRAMLPMLQLEAGSVTVHVAEPTETVTDPLVTSALLAVRTVTAKVAADSAP